MKAVTVPIGNQGNRSPRAWELVVPAGAGDTLDNRDSPGTRVSALYLRQCPVVRPSLQQGLGPEGLSEQNPMCLCSEAIPDT